MRIKVKHLVKWFLMLFPLILFFTLYLKMGDELFVHGDDILYKNAFIGFMADTAECCGSLFNPVSRVIKAFIAPDFQFDLFYFFDEDLPQYNFRGCIIFCFCWLILVYMLWSLLEFMSHLWHNLTKMEEE